MQIRQETTVTGSMRMTNRFTRRRTFTTHFTTPSHTGTPWRKLRNDIVADSPSEKQDLPLQYLKGVGPARAKLLGRMGVHSAIDLLTQFPRDWQDRRHRFSLKEAPLDEK